MARGVLIDPNFKQSPYNVGFPASLQAREEAETLFSCGRWPPQLDGALALRLAPDSTALCHLILCYILVLPVWLLSVCELETLGWEPRTEGCT